jgi:outer membrane protein OmpA-like peptidoglycan-associated protein
MTVARALPSRTARFMGVAALALAAVLLGGCKNNKASGPTADDLLAENRELRDRNQMIEDALNAAEARNAELASENAAMKDSLSARPSGPSGSTGFEGTGADISLRDQSIVVSVAGDVLFASGSADLRSSAKQTLDQIAGVLNSRYGSSRLEIAGHTDSDPLRKTKDKWTDNENLSAQRALAVERYLASKGVSADRMHIAGYGPSMPRGDKAKSRRVEIVVLGN